MKPRSIQLLIPLLTTKTPSMHNIFNLIRSQNHVRGQMQKYLDLEFQEQKKPASM